MRAVTSKRAAAAFCGVVMLVSEGCSSSHPQTTAHAGPASSLSARQALAMALTQESHITSALATITVHVTGASRATGAPSSSTSAGAMQIRLQPAVVVASSLLLSAGGKTIPMQEIKDGGNIYLKLASLSGMTGKPWALVRSSAASSSPAGGPGQNPGNGNPLTSDKLLATAKNLHRAGTQVINGSVTTRYDGSYPASETLNGLPPSVRKVVAAKIKNRGPVQMSVWINARHQLKRLVSTQTIGSQTITTTIDITAVNVPVHITLPPASQVAHVPASALGGL
jgi:hypothetical protein